MLFLKLKQKVLSNKIAIKHQHGRGSCFDKIWHGSDWLHKSYCVQEVNFLLIFFVTLMTNFANKKIKTTRDVVHLPRTPQKSHTTSQSS